MNWLRKNRSVAFRFHILMELKLFFFFFLHVFTILPTQSLHTTFDFYLKVISCTLWYKIKFLHSNYRVNRSEMKRFALPSFLAYSLSLSVFFSSHYFPFHFLFFTSNSSNSAVSLSAILCFLQQSCLFYKVFSLSIFFSVYSSWFLGQWQWLIC